MAFVLLLLNRPASAQSYTIVDTGQTTFYSNVSTISEPGEEDAFYGQDAQYSGVQADYSLVSGGGVVQDNNTGLFWTQSIDIDGAAGIDIDDKLTRTELNAYVQQLNNTSFGGRTDWRVPSVKELYSLIRFDGIQPRPTAQTGTGGQFFLDSVFDFEWGDVAGGDRIIDMQVWSSTDYTSTTMNGDQSFLSVNFADGRIKAYPLQQPGSGAARQYYAMVVAGNTEYGVNDLVDNGDGTLTDRATSLEWTQNDSTTRMTWQEALAYVQDRNSENYLGHTDWRLPNAKELQSLVDYARSPDATGSPAIDPLFNLTATEQTAQVFTGSSGDFGYHWTSTTFLELGQSDELLRDDAVYISFFESLANPFGSVLDAHGAGAQRTDPKAEGVLSSGDFHGPQSDYISIDNYVLLVRDQDAASTVDLPGDYNNDKVVDAADYALWRLNLGAPPGTLENDIHEGEIGYAQYLTWRSYYGSYTPSEGGEHTAAAPEPAAISAIAVGVLVLSGSRPARGAYRRVKKHSG